MCPNCTTMRYLLLSSLLALGPTASSQIPDYVPTDGLVAYYPFNGNPNDVSGNNHHAENDGAVLVQDRFGESSAAYSFSGAERIVAPNSVSPVGSEERTINVHFVSYTELPIGNNTYSLQGLFGSGSPSSGKVISTLNIDGQGTNNGHLPRPGHVYFSSGSWYDEAWSEESVSDSMWHMATMVYSGPNTAVQVFVDGQFQDETEPITLNTHLSAFYIGDVPWAALFFNGIIDDVGVWDRPLGEEEILGLYLADAPNYGCTNEEACNFNPEANVDDGSCIPAGCMDSQACNFNTMAECEGEACDYTCCPGPGCCSLGHYWDWDLEKCFDIVPSDTDFDGCVSMTDLLDLLTVFGTCAEEDSEEELGEWSCGDPLEYQGYDYETVQIGDQCWFAENLRSESYENGDVISAGLSDDEWSLTESGATAIYGEGVSGCSHLSPAFEACNEALAYEEYGFLYNWYAVDDQRGVCPSGWHVPFMGEFQSLSATLGGDAHAGLALKATSGWFDNGNGTNESGFDGLPGGFRHQQAQFEKAGYDGIWWMNYSVGESAKYLGVVSYSNAVFYETFSKNYGFSIRCIKDAE